MGDFPFTTEQFLQVFREYNQAIWPAQGVGYMLGGVILWLLVNKRRGSADTYINSILGLFWIWMGVAYHMVFFAAINPAAYIFGTFFMVQGIAFVMLSRSEVKLYYGFHRDSYGSTGMLFILYAMVIYPVLGYLLGHGYPESPVFGVAPCPTTIFTFGVLLQARGGVPLWLLVIPAFWSLIGFSAALHLTIYEDVGLVIAGVGGVLMLWYRNGRPNNTPAADPGRAAKSSKL
ncbi:hypothetical protein SAMN06265218_106201 [Fodinibius sediminis]|uniref:Uncharacterized protein n=2 Tax=Fodinibius sediminis TaxID=1214077 RepID=A0A521CM65_9BACT|nr:hypothetical protein SAMN06265218_106201 [Fodinibius sediminis]